MGLQRIGVGEHLAAAVQHEGTDLALAATQTVSAVGGVGLMLGIVPAFAEFFGLGLQVRHVTLSAGQVSAAAMALASSCAAATSAGSSESVFSPALSR